MMNKSTNPTPLHPTSQRIYDAIQNEWNATGRMPTRRSLMRLTGHAHTTITDHLCRLEDAGYIRVQAHIDRGIILCQEPTPGQLKAQINALVAELARCQPLAERYRKERQTAEQRNAQFYEKLGINDPSEEIV